MKMFCDISQVDTPVLNDGRLYIYVLENEPQGNIKIGKTTNLQQRLQSLSGSNSGGNHIIKIAVSDATYLYTLERISHQHFDKYRIKGTEWFHDDSMTFTDAVEFVDSLFARHDYILCNNARRDFVSRFGYKNIEN